MNLEGAKSHEEDGIGLGKKMYTFPEQNVYVLTAKRIRFLPPGEGLDEGEGWLCPVHQVT